MLPKPSILLSILLTCLAVVSIVSGAPTFDWDAGAGTADRDWGNSTNWTDDVEPASTNTAHINGGYTAVVSQVGEAAYDLLVGDDGTGTVRQVGGALMLGDGLTLGQSSGEQGTYVMTNGVLNVGTNLLVGDGGAGIMSVSGGSITVGGFFRLGNAAGAHGTLSLSGGAVTASNDFIVGGANSATGLVEQTGGTLKVLGNNPLNVGAGGAGRYGFYTITNGMLEISGGGSSDIRIGYTSAASGTGVFHVVGGQATISVQSDFWMSDKTNAELRVTIVDGALAPIQAGNDIKVYGMLTVTNAATPLSDEYIVVTSTSPNSVSGAFAATNWAGGVQGKVIYGADYVSLIFSPEMEVFGTNVSLVVTNNDTTPTTADGTDFDEVELPYSRSHTFTITNSDLTYALNLTGATVVAVSGAHASDFIVTDQALTPVGAASNTTFTIEFTPLVVGVRTAQVSIANNDISEDENPYTFSLLGTGVYAQEPTSHSSNLVFSVITNIAMTVSWDKGNGAKRILVARAGSAVSGLPADGSNYTASAAFSNGHTITTGEYVVYSDAGTSVRVPNLLPGVTYHFKLFEYNGTQGGINYLTGGPLSGIQATATYAPNITEGDSTGVTMSENSSPTAFSLALNRTDADLPYGDLVTWSIRNAPEHGAAQASGTGAGVTVSYTPALYYSGSDSFVVQAIDKFGNEDTITVNVTIEAVNPPGKTIFIFE